VQGTRRYEAGRAGPVESRGEINLISRFKKE
jgi:hypothetical protein